AQDRPGAWKTEAWGNNDKVEGRVTLIGTEIANACRDNFEIEVALLWQSSSGRRPPHRHRLEAELGAATSIESERRHPGAEIGERRIVELPVPAGVAAAVAARGLPFR